METSVKMANEEEEEVDMIETIAKEALIIVMTGKPYK